MGEIAIERQTSRTRSEIFTGIFFLVLAVSVFLLLPPRTEGLTSTFVLTSLRAGVTIAAPDLVLPTWTTILIVGILLTIAGVWQLVRPISGVIRPQRSYQQASHMASRTHEMSGCMLGCPASALQFSRDEVERNCATSVCSSSRQCAPSGCLDLA